MSPEVMFTWYMCVCMCMCMCMCVCVCVCVRPTVHLPLDAVQVGWAAVANGDGGRGHASVQVQHVPRHRQLKRTNQSTE